MKKLVCFLSIAVIMLVSVVTAFAHQGRTDGKGGHYDRDTGEYHYHHGYSAHQHDGGTCPYDFDDAEENNYKFNDYSAKKYESHSENNHSQSNEEWDETVFWIIVAIALIALAIFLILMLK